MTGRVRRVSLLILLLAALALPARAADGGVYVLLENTTQITLGEEDTFLLTCQTEDGDTLELELSFLEGSSVMELSLRDGTYTVTDLCYLGPREEVKTSGYGIAPFFTAGPDFGTVTLALGEEALNSLTDLYHLAIVKDTLHDDSGDWLPKAPDTEETQSEETGEDIRETDLLPGKTDPREANKASAEPVLTWYPEPDREDPERAASVRGTIGIHLAVCALLCALGVGILLLAGRHKKESAGNSRRGGRRRP